MDERCARVSPELSCRLIMLKNFGYRAMLLPYESYGRKLVTDCSGGVLDLLESVVELHSLDDLGEVV